MQPQANGDLLPRRGQKPGKPTDCKPPHACHGVSMAARAGPVGSVPFGALAGSQKTQARPRHAPSRSTRRRQPPCAPQAASGQTPSGTGLSLANTHRPRPWHCATGDQETWGQSARQDDGHDDGHRYFEHRGPMTPGRCACSDVMWQDPHHPLGPASSLSSR
jgi:hypothetical protein